MSLLTNPVLVSVVVLCVLCLLKLNVLMSLIIAAMTGAVLGGISIPDAMGILCDGFSGNANTALAYVLLGTFAMGPVPGTLILLVKSLLGSAKPLYVLPGCCLGGAAFCLLCDLIARSLFAPTELSISAVTAVFGAPVVIWLLIRRNQEGAR